MVKGKFGVLRVDLQGEWEMNKVTYKPEKKAINLDERKSLKPYGEKLKTNKTAKEGKKK